MDKFQLEISGISMSPLIADGSTLHCVKLFSKLNLADIVLFKDATTNELTCHRIVSLSPLITKGDNSYHMDSPQEYPPIAVVEGINSTYWGRDGHKFKMMFYFISKYFMVNKYSRKIGKLILIILSKLLTL